MFCRNCGGEIPEEAVVCMHCGVPVAQAPQHGPPPEYRSAPPPPYGPMPHPEAKSKIVAGILGIVLGGLGVHRFYLGYVGIGILQILVTLVTCGVGALWGFIEGIVILVGGMPTDARGIPLKD